MERAPIFPFPSKNIDPGDFLRNYFCPHYDTCLREAADQDLLLDCDICGYKTARVSTHTGFERYII
jgi:hypothetical protein